jgi:hypothetical protein
VNAFAVGVMDKLAATIEQLRQGTSRLGFVRADIKNPNKMFGNIVGGGRIGPREYAAIGGGVFTHPPARAVNELTRQQTRATRRTALLAGASRSQVREGMSQLETAREGMKKRLMAHGKKSIIVAGGGKMTPSHVIGEMTGKKLSPEARKAVNVASLHHEGFERAAMKKGRRMSYGYGHASPEVLAKEHNLYARLTGKGADEARAAIQNVRGQAGDAEALNKLLKKRFGARAGITYGQGQKIPKAMRKALRRGPVSKIWERMPGA